MTKVILGLLALITLILACTGCTRGGYIQLGYIPVTEVRDVHTTIKQPPRLIKSNSMEQD